MKHIAVSLALVATLIASTSAARAQVQCPAMDGASAALERASTAERLDFIRTRLRAERRSMRKWKLAWSLTIAGIGLTQLGLALIWEDEVDLKVITLDEDYDIDFYAGAIRSVIGSSSMWLFPKPRIYLAPSSGDDCEALAAAEKALQKSASSTKAGRGFIKHAGVVALNLAYILTIGLAFDRWQSAILGGAGGVVVGEIIIYTQPTGAVDALADYRAGDLGTAAPTSWNLVPSPVGDHGFGLSLAGTF